MKLFTNTPVFFTVLLMSFILSSAAIASPLNDVLTDAADGKLVNYTLLQAAVIIDKTTAGEASQFKSKLETKTAEYSGKDAETILKALQGKLLKQFWPGSSLKAMLDEGKYDPLWGTAVFVEILKKNGFDCKVVETPANFLVSIKDGGSESLYDVFAGKNPIKTNFNDYITKTVGLRSTAAVSKFPAFNLATAERSDCSRILTGFLQKRLLQDLADDDYNDFESVVPLVRKTFPSLIIDQDKLAENIAKKLKESEDSKNVAPLLEIAVDVAKAIPSEKKELSDNSILAARKGYLQLKNAKDLAGMEKYLVSIKPLVAKDIFTPMAKEGYLIIHNDYWAKKNYPKVEEYAWMLWKELGVVQAKEFWQKSALVGAQTLAKAQKYNEAMAIVDKVVKEDPKSDQAKKLREYIYTTQYTDLKAKNKFEDMLVVLSKLRVIYPEKETYHTAMVKTYWTWGKSFIDANQYSEAVRVLSEGYKKCGNNATLKEFLSKIYFNYGVLLFKDNKFEEAIEILKKGNDVLGDQDSKRRNDLIADLYLSLSISTDKAGDRGKAKMQAEKGLIYSPDSQELKTQIDNLQRGKASVEQKQIETAPWE